MAWSWEGAEKGASSGSTAGGIIGGFGGPGGAAIGSGIGFVVGGVAGGLFGGDPMEAALQRAAISMMTVDAREKYIDATQRTQSQVAQKSAYNEAVKQRNQSGASGQDAINQQELAKQAGYEASSVAATEGEVARKARQDQVMAGVTLGKDIYGAKKGVEAARYEAGYDPSAGSKQMAQYIADYGTYKVKGGSYDAEGNWVEGPRGAPEFKPFQQPA